MTKPVGFDIDMFMDETGHFGKCEMLTYSLLSISIIYTAFASFEYVFTAGIINHRCAVSECENISKTEYEPEWITHAMDFTDETLCERYNSTILLQELPNTVNSSCPAKWFNKSQLITCRRKDLVYQYEDITIMQEFNLQCEEASLLPLVGTLQNVGQAFGFPALGLISDKYGRKPTLIISTIFTCIFGFIHFVNDHLYDFIIVEMLMAVFITGTYNSAYVLGVELVGKNARLFGGVLISSFYCMGITLLGVTAKYITHWRTYSYVHLPFIMCVGYYWVVPESTRWLNTKGKEEILRKELIQIGKMKGYKYSNDDLEKFRATKAEADDHLQTDDAEAEDGSVNVNPEAVLSKKIPRLSKLFHSRTLCLRLLNCYYCWITNSLVYGGLQLAAVSTVGDRHVNFIITGLVEIPAYVVTPLLADHIGRRITLCIALLICGICNGCYVFLSSSTGGTIIYFVAKFAITIAYSVIYVFTAELFPTEMRHTILGSCSMVARIGATTAPQWRNINSVKKGLAFYIFSFTSITSGLLIFLLPETLHLKLPDTIEEAKRLGKDPIS